MAKGQVFCLQSRPALETGTQCGKKARNEIFIWTGRLPALSANSNSFNADEIFSRDSQ